jgi:hypothetical protein
LQKCHIISERGYFPTFSTVHYPRPYWALDVALVVAAGADGGVAVVGDSYGEVEVAVVELSVVGGGLDGVGVADTGLVEGAGSTMTVLVDVAARSVWSVATY